MRTTRQRAQSRDRENKKRAARREAKKQARPASDGFRKLVLASGEWKWQAGKSNVVVVSPAGKKSVVDYSRLLGLPWHVIENLQENKGLWVMPGEMRGYIESNLTELS